MAKADIGLIGLAVMGQNLVLNMARNGYVVSVYNRTVSKVDDFMKHSAKDNDNVISTYSLEEFVQSLKKPRKVFLMVKAGTGVDDTIKNLIPYLEKGDIIIDGGNSYFKDTRRRIEWMNIEEILYMGVGVSGGEEGALNGPSIMPGGDVQAWWQVEKILTDISAKVNENVPCCSYMGPDGAGHYVKMVHNGIEYGDMQLISEAYYLMKVLLKMSAKEIKSVFAKWNGEELNSYLIAITADILGRTDELTGNPLVDVILDAAQQKGTGKWTAQEALDLGVSIPTITEAVFARNISAIKDERVRASEQLSGPEVLFEGDKEKFIADIKDALYASKICSYAQGFALLKTASDEYNWNLELGEIALLWRGGCIIRARFLNSINDAFTLNPQLENLLLDPFFKDVIHRSQSGWRRVISAAALKGIPIPAFSSALSYFDSYRSESLPANLIQAQRDYFGAHTYKRIDREGTFHTEWLELD
ncbi:decarboxylating NADP(+)-dependent phosphogluconate dehydrogenase [Petroclostridium sp. X23]|uniref:decarboxylating NADP(+)-dependent phosphogluconate dehydrogenase n=1 Tax=Petroclostridium sp. X23 TaxID=3045146 RepID=UPI0024ADDC3F|nr:decarboxylating NADP(+)-dependent phosphogluconate dehydrogenase [Petroclostridium sp. X23]WHH58088.1 decarboxylating NADP(+)-dependent phosphogluconate dehydrogenase [Petroclostridium sp. X23]